MAQSGFHQITVLGHVGRDPELTVTPDGTPLTKFTMAVTEKFGQEETTTWYNCTAWRGLAEVIEKYVQKGQMILVIGRPQVRQYTTKDGRPGVSNDVTVDKFSFAGGNGTGRGDDGSTSFDALNAVAPLK